MADFMMDALPSYPVTSTVQVYPEQAIVNGSGPTSAPVASAVVSATGVLTFSGLAADVPYVAAQLQSGAWRLKHFSVSVPKRDLTTLDSALVSVQTDVRIVKEAPLNVRSTQGGPAVMGDTTDESTNILAKFTALPAAGGQLYFPPPTSGHYRMTVPIPLTKHGTHIIGDGRSAVPLRNAVSDVFQVATAGTYVEKVRIEGIEAQSESGGGHVFNVVGGFSQSHISDVNLRQSNTGKSIWYQPDTTGTNDAYIDNTVENSFLEHVAGATVPAWYLYNATALHNRNVWRELRCLYSGEYFFHIESADPANYQLHNTFRDINFEICNGGCIKGLSVFGTVLEDLYVYDLAGATTRDLFYIGASPTGGFRSVGTVFKNVQRLGGSLGSGLYDIKLQTGQARHNFMQAVGKSSLLSFAVDLGGNEALIQQDWINTLDGVTAANVVRFPAALGKPIFPALGLGTAVGGGESYIEAFEQTADPAAPAADGRRLFVKDVSTKTMLASRANTGATELHPGMLRVGVTWDPASIADGAQTSTTATVTGAAIGDPVSVGFDKAVPAGAQLTADVTAADTVTVKLINHTGAVMDLISGTLRIYVWKA